MFGLENLIENMRLFKVLIAGERGPDRRNVRQLLQTIGFSNFREAVDGDDVLRKLRSQEINLTISDVEMPLVNGLEIADIIRKEPELENHPLLLLVSSPVEISAVTDTETELDGWLQRPLHPQVLEDKVVEILFKRLVPSALDAHLQASGAALARGYYSKAHEELDRAARINSDSPMVSYLRRLVYLAQGQPRKAEEAIKIARQAFINSVNLPKKARKMLELGEAKLEQGQIEEAAAAFDKAIEMAVNKAKYKTLIGEAYLARGMAEKAEDMFKASIEETPDDVHLYNRLGIAYRRQKKFDEAISNYRKAIVIDPYEENLRYNLARAYLAAGDRENTLNTLEKALEIMPGFKEARQLMDRLSGSHSKNRSN